MFTKFGIFAVFAAALAVGGSAQAATVSYNYGTQNAALQPNSIVSSSYLAAYDPSFIDVATGYIAANTSITFTYTLVPALGAFSTGKLGADAQLYASGSNLYLKNGQVYGGSSEAYAPAGYAPTNNVTYPAGSSPLITATANISGDTVGTTTITNASSQAAYFISQLQGSFLGELIKVTGVVSAVPLPASLSMLILVLAALAGFTALNRARA